MTIIVLTQSREDLISRTVAAAGARQAIVHYNACAPAFRKVVFNMSRDEIKNIATTGTRLVTIRGPASGNAVALPVFA